MSDTSKKKALDLSLMKRVFHFVKPYRSFFIASLTLVIIMAIFAPVRPYLIQLTVNKSIHNELPIPHWIQQIIFLKNSNDIFSFIVNITIFQIVFLLVESVVRFAFTFITSLLGQNVVKDLRVTVFEKVVNLNLSQFDKTPIGKLTTRTINDIENIKDIFSDG